MRRYRLTLKDAPPVNVDTYGGGGGSTAPVSPYKPSVAIYMPAPAQPPRVPYQNAQVSPQPIQPVSPNVHIERYGAAVVKSFTQPPLPAYNPILDMISEAQQTQQAALSPAYRPPSFSIVTGYRPSSLYREPAPLRPTAPATPKISMEEARTLASQYVNQVSLLYGEKNPLNIRAANEKLRQVKEIQVAIEIPGYTVQDVPDRKGGGYRVVNTINNAQIPGSIRWGHEYEEGTAVRTGHFPADLPGIQAKLLKEAIELAARISGRPAPRLPEIARPAVIARSQ